jgi:Flp pilus assembly protein TadG
VRMSEKVCRKGERGATVAEFAVIAGFFFMMIFGIIEFGRLLYTHNALTDAARRGARYGVIHPQNAKCVQNAVIYGETNMTAYPECNPTGSPLINGITSPDVEIKVVYDPPTKFDMNVGTATVTITKYQFYLSIPFFAQTLTMPDYTTTLSAESAGRIPDDI